MEVTQFIKILREGENQKVEFKSSVQKEIAPDISKDMTKVRLSKS
jgi:hypothetical protein